MCGIIVVKVDKSGRVYLPKALRKRLTTVAEGSRGIFKLKKRVDVDREIRRLSVEEMERQLGEIRGR